MLWLKVHKISQLHFLQNNTSSTKQKQKKQRGGDTNHNHMLHIRVYIYFSLVIATTALTATTSFLFACHP